MSLSRQLQLLVLILYAAVFTGNFWLTLDNTRRYAATQLESHAQDAATALGLSLSPHMAGGDTLLMESMVDAIFDRGFYRRIEVTDSAGQLLIKRDVQVQVAGVPGWFIDWLGFNLPVGEAIIMAGWQPGGAVQVESHPGFAYGELWGSAVEMLGWSALTLVLALMGTMVGLRFALRPLADMERAALAVGEREFRPISPVPRARELRRVVEAMNLMTDKVEAMVTEQHSSTQRQLHDAFIDPVTLLGNRAAFEREVNRMVARQDESLFGTVVLCQLAGLDELNRNAGYQRGDAMLRVAAASLAGTAGEEDGFAARLGGGLFGIVLPGSARSDQDELLARLRAGVSDALVAEGYTGRVEAGAAYYAGSQPAATLMQRAQDALHQVRVDAEAELVRLHDATEVASGSDTTQSRSWKSILESVLAERAVVLHYQAAVMLADGSVFHDEVLARLDTGGERLVEPGMFMPMATRVGMSMALDQVIVEVALEKLAALPAARFSLNVSRTSALDAEFARWLGDRLASGAAADRLSFEVQERTFAADPHAVLGLAEAIRASGAAIGLDRCGAVSLELADQRALRASFHKIDGQFIRGVDGSTSAQRYAESMLRTRHGLDIMVIAERVESEEEADVLRALGFDAAQGFHLSAPGDEPS